MARHSRFSGDAAPAGLTESLTTDKRLKFPSPIRPSRDEAVLQRVYERAEARWSRAAVYVLRNANVSGQACATATGL